MKYYRKFLLVIYLVIIAMLTYAQSVSIDKQKVKEDLEEIISDISTRYVYFSEKGVDINCIRTYYSGKIEQLKTENDVILFFEYLLDEFYDSHLILNTNTTASYRLYAPIYVSLKETRFIISSVWQTQIESLTIDIVGAEVKKINGIDISQSIELFPTHCHNKSNPVVREWIANKILAGTYQQPRIIELQLRNQQSITLDLNQLKIKKENNLLSVDTKNHIGIIRINNSLGNNSLIEAFDRSLDSLLQTKAIILDLRNTVDGGNSYVARGIMGRFVSTIKAYQKHQTVEKYGTGPAVERSWMEYVSPRSKPYQKPLIVLVGRWTGSMGEGLAIGLEAAVGATIIGSEMERLAGEMGGFSFHHQKFGYRLSTAKLFHVNGTPREQYKPSQYVQQTTITRDEVLEKALAIIKNN
ncbi:MAG: hypothetical protein IBJ16_06895 [Chitinophagaceae bacterium]|nr:hypothetical protein [Chitinophagaceae bacterium]